jgi:two-component system OmpR family response regulator
VNVENGQDKKRILVVEDERDVAGLLEARLEASGYDVRVETRGRDALAEASARRPDLVILDLMLPDLDGYAVSKGLRALYGPWEVRILMLTALGMPQAKLYGYAAGADAYLTKPYDAQELVGIVERLLSEPG